MPDQKLCSSSFKSTTKKGKNEKSLKKKLKAYDESGPQATSKSLKAAWFCPVWKKIAGIKNINTNTSYNYKLQATSHLITYILQLHALTYCQHFYILYSPSQKWFWSDMSFIFDFCFWERFLGSNYRKWKYIYIE